MSFISTFQLLDRDDLGDRRLTAGVPAAPATPLRRADAERLSQDLHLLQLAPDSVHHGPLREESRPGAGEGAEAQAEERGQPAAAQHPRQRTLLADGVAVLARGPTQEALRALGKTTSTVSAISLKFVDQI